jgi:hypothetical protein
VACIAAVHDALSNVDAAARNVTIGIDVRNSIDRSSVNAHAQLDFRPVTKTFYKL